MDNITADILVVGGGAGGTAAAIQAARHHKSLRVVLVSELPWLGGMLTSAGVSAPDGNELAAFQTGLWGAFLKSLRQKHSEGLGHGWVSFFTYNPAIGAQIFADWTSALPNLQWISGESPQEVLRSGDRIAGIRFNHITVQATLTIDGTELGDVLALGNVPYRWGWETQDMWQEPSAPASLSDPQDPLFAITQRYPVQSPTWVAIMQDYGKGQAPNISRPPSVSTSQLTDLFAGAWANYGDAQTSAGEACLNYGRLPGDLFMINWPHKGNDYGVGLERLVESDKARAQYGKEAQQHSQAFAHYIQNEIGDRRYGLAQNIFPKTAQSPGSGFALMPYYRESRRLVGITTVSEHDILPQANRQAAQLPINHKEQVEAIALGNYPNDHHYPGFEMPLAPKAIRWGGRWTGTPFTIPYSALIPQTIDGLLACEKNISVSHIANGATRLQPVVLGIGQAAGTAAALCILQKCEPRELDVRSLQAALIADPTAPAAVVPLFNLPPEHPDWHSLQHFYLTHPDEYPASGHHSFATSQKVSKATTEVFTENAENLRKTDKFESIWITGEFRENEANEYNLYQNTVENLPKCIRLVTIRSEITDIFSHLESNQQVQVLGTWNSSGKWLLCSDLKAH